MTQNPPSRRAMLGTLAVAAGVAAIGTQAAIVVRSFVPNVSYDPPTNTKLGSPESFADGLTFVAERRLFIHRDGKTFRAMSAICTHLGCTVRAEAAEEADPSDSEGRRQVQTTFFACPCHGLRYRADGLNISGPAPRPLAAHRLSLAPDDGQLVADLGDEVGRAFVLTLP